MTESPSQFLMEMLRVASDSVGMSSAELANATGIDEERLEAIMEGREPITVDEFMLLALELELGLDELGLPMVPAPLDSDELSLGDILAPGDSGDLAAGEEIAVVADPGANQVAQVMQLGFALGCDIFFIAETEKLSESGLPEEVLLKFSEQMPIRLDAAFHRHMAPKYSEEGLTLLLSFGSLYTCCIPWDAFTQVTLYPMAPQINAPPEEAPKPSRAHLRLVD